jgi:hypothetical protein
MKDIIEGIQNIILSGLLVLIDKIGSLFRSKKPHK